MILLRDKPDSSAQVNRPNRMSCAFNGNGPDESTISHSAMSISAFHSIRNTRPAISGCEILNIHNLHNFNDNGDKISNLPDCILHHILSFLPTKDSVGTCILSTRWKHMWTSVPNIDLDDEVLYSSELSGWPLEVSCFMNFVERVLLLRNSSSMIRFRLSCRVCFSAARVHAWLSAAILHHVQELDLCLFVDNSFILPRCMFYSKTLTVLKIQLTCILDLPTCISLPLLKTLHLRLVTFPNDISTQRLVSSCPVLEDLAIIDCEWMHLKSITISIPSLKNLTIDDLPYFGPSDDLHGCDIIIDAINLSELKYLGHLSNELFLHNVRSLSKAYVHIPIRKVSRSEIATRAVKLLYGLRNVKSFSITNRTIKSLSYAYNVRDHFPVFKNLMHLEVSMAIENHTVGQFMELLLCSRNLQSLDLAEGLDHEMNYGEDYWYFTSVPGCLLSFLKTVSFRNFHGYDAEMCFLKYFLKNSLVLEKMNVYGSKNLVGHPNEQIEAKNQLHAFARGSASCIIRFF